MKSLRLMRRCVVVALVVVIRRVAIRAWQFLGHNNFRAAGAARNDVELVHEGAHQKYSASGGAQKIFFGQWVGNVAKIEAFRSLQYGSAFFVRLSFYTQVYFF